MEENTDKNIWFKYKKNYFWGFWLNYWPCCWQGWAVVLIESIIICVGVLILLKSGNSLGINNKIIVISFIAIIMVFRSYIRHKKGEKIDPWKLRGGKSKEDWDAGK